MISEKNFFRLLVLSLASIMAVHILATFFYLYWRIWWLDIFLHFLGGLWVGSLAVWFFFLSKKVSVSANFFIIVLIVVSSAALVGVLWELMEFILDNMFAAKNYLHWANMQLGARDTVSDLFFDLLGGLMAGLIFAKKYGRQNQ